MIRKFVMAPEGAPAAGAPAAGTITGGNAPAAGAPAAGGAPAGGQTPPSINFPDNWREAIPQELRDDPAFKVVTDIPNLAKMYVHGQRQIGSDKIIVPGKSATDEDWNQIYRKLGVPEKLEEYQLDKPKDTKYTEGELKSFKEQVHKLGIQPRQAAGLLNWLESKNVEVMTQLENTKKSEREANVAAIRTQFGAAYDKEIAGVQAVFREFGDPEAKAFLESSGLTDNPHLVRVFAKVSKLLGEDKIRQGGGGEGSIFSPDAAQKEINKILGDAKGAYYDKNHADHNRMVQEMQRLQKMKLGEQP